MPFYDSMHFIKFMCHSLSDCTCLSPHSPFAFYSRAVRMQMGQIRAFYRKSHGDDADGGFT